MNRAEERELIKGCVAGDARAWDRFVREVAPYLAQVARRALARCGLPCGDQEVDDLKQEVLAAILADGCRILKGFQGRSSLQGYLATLVVRRVLAKPRGAPSLPPSLALAAPESEPELERDETRRLVRSAMHTLPLRVRIALLMQIEGASLREVGRALGLSEDAAAQVVSRGRNALKVELTRLGMGR